MNLELHGYGDEPEPVPKKLKRFVVRRYKGDAALEAGITLMARYGYVVQDRTTTKKGWDPLTGVLTSKQIHSVTFRLVT